MVIGDSVTSIGSYAFRYCSSLQFNEYGNTKYLASADNAYFALIEVTSQNYSSYTIHPDTKIIAGYAFSGCSRLAKIEIPDSVTSIGNFAFSDCSSLTSVVIPDSVTSIGRYAFYYCSSLTSVVIPNSVTSIGDYAFTGCSSLKNITFKGTIAKWRTIKKSSMWSFDVTASKVVCSDGSVAI